MTLDELLAQLGRGRTVPYRPNTRQEGGVKDPYDLMSAQVKAGEFPGSIAPDSGDAAPAIDDAFDESIALSFVSSNVYSGYFRRYNKESEAYQDNSVGRGDLYLTYWKRKGDKPGGELHVSGPRSYVYQNVSEAIWEAFMHAASPGGLSWDLLRHGGVPGDPI